MTRKQLINELAKAKPFSTDQQYRVLLGELIDQYVDWVIGEDIVCDVPSCFDHKVRNHLRTEQRTRAGINQQKNK